MRTAPRSASASHSAPALRSALAFRSALAAAAAILIFVGGVQPAAAQPASVPPAAIQSGGDAFRIARIKYDGGGDWYGDEKSLDELLRFVRANTLLNVAPKEDVVELKSDKLFTYPYLYLTGHGNVTFSEAEARRLRRYLDGGGFLHIDDNYGLDEHIRRELKKVYPEKTLQELPHDHPIYHTHYDFPDGLPKIHRHDGKPPQGFGLFSDDGRLVVFYSYESDLGDGWEPESVHHDPPEKRRAALRMGTNILTYALMH